MNFRWPSLEAFARDTRSRGVRVGDLLLFQPIPLFGYVATLLGPDELALAFEAAVNAGGRELDRDDDRDDHGVTTWSRLLEAAILDRAGVKVRIVGLPGGGTTRRVDGQDRSDSGVLGVAVMPNESALVVRDAARTEPYRLVALGRFDAVLKAVRRDLVALLPLSCGTTPTA